MGWVSIRPDSIAVINVRKNMSVIDLFLVRESADDLVDDKVEMLSVKAYCRALLCGNGSLIYRHRLHLRIWYD